MGDERGSLTSLERATGFPFEIARVYFIYDTLAGVSRGFHAHQRLRQVAVCVSGSCSLVLDDGKTRTQIRLERRDRGVEIGPMIWREMHDFSVDCVLVVLADSAYDERDYIRDYPTFVDLTQRD